jgi:hypothetical protein
VPGELGQSLSLIVMTAVSAAATFLALGLLTAHVLG